jgi:hypothetical protein
VLYIFVDCQRAWIQHSIHYLSRHGSVVLIFGFDIWAVFGLDGAEVFHCTNWCFSSGIYIERTRFRGVTTLFKKFAPFYVFSKTEEPTCCLSCQLFVFTYTLELFSHTLFPHLDLFFKFVSAFLCPHKTRLSSLWSLNSSLYSPGTSSFI